LEKKTPSNNCLYRVFQKPQRITSAGYLEKKLPQIIAYTRYFKNLKESLVPGIWKKKKKNFKELLVPGIFGKKPQRIGSIVYFKNLKESLIPGISIHRRLHMLGFGPNPLPCPLWVLYMEVEPWLNNMG